MLKKIILALSLAMLPLSAAYADRGDRGGDHRGGRDRDRGHYDHGKRDHGRGHSHYSRPRTVVSFNYGYSPYYRPYSYYQPATVVYAAPPAVVQPQVVYMNDVNSREVANEDGRYCREYQSKVKVGGQTQETFGRACQQPDGSWEIIS